MKKDNDRIAIDFPRLFEELGEGPRFVADVCGFNWSTMRRYMKQGFVSQKIALIIVWRIKQKFPQIGAPLYHFKARGKKYTIRRGGGLGLPPLLRVNKRNEPNFRNYRNIRIHPNENGKLETYQKKLKNLPDEIVRIESVLLEKRGA